MIKKITRCLYRLDLTPPDKSSIVYIDCTKKSWIKRKLLQWLFGWRLVPQNTYYRLTGDKNK